MELAALKTYQRYALMALDVFLGKSNEDIAKQHNYSVQTVINARKMHSDIREKMLKAYFLAGAGDVGRNAVIEEFGGSPERPTTTVMPDVQRLISEALSSVETAFTEKLHIVGNRMGSLEDRIRDYESQLSGIETNVKSLANTAAITEAEDDGYTLDRKAKYQNGDIRKENYRVHVTHKAVDDWKRHFGSGAFNNSTNAIGPDATFHDIRRRITGLYYAGNISGSGGAYVVTGINRYSSDGVKLKCAVDTESVYINQVEKVPLTQI